MLRTALDIGTDYAMMSPLRHNPCTYRNYSLVEKLDIHRRVTQIDTIMIAMLREEELHDAQCAHSRRFWISLSAIGIRKVFPK